MTIAKPKCPTCVRAQKRSWRHGVRWRQVEAHAAQAGCIETEAAASRKQLYGAVKREEGQQNVGFSSRPFVLCGLPGRKPPAREMLYARRNADFVLQITGHPNFGLPFDQDRIVPIYLADACGAPKSQTIRFRTVAEMLETFGMHKGGKEYRRLVAAFERIFGATIFFGTDAASRNGQGVPALAMQLLP